MRNTVLSRSFAILSVLTLLVMSQPSTASAAPVAADATPIVDLTCPGSMTVNFSPGVTLLPSPQTITATLKGGTGFLSGVPCTSLSGGAPYTGVTAVFTGSGDVSCGLAFLSGTAILTWNNGDTSTVSVSVIFVQLVPIITATVTAGALKGSAVVLTGVPTGFTGVCGILSPTTSLSVIGLAEFVDL